MALIKGTANDDILNGTGLADTVLADAGNDIVNGEGGADIIYGGAGEDELRGGGGADTVYGEAGNDTLIGGAGSDTTFGGSGDDTFQQLNDGRGNSVYGGAGSDTLDLSTSTLGWTLNGLTGAGSAGAATLTFSSIETLTGSAFGDTVTAGGDVARVDAGDGDDTLISGGTAGQSISLYGGSGNDTLQASGTTSQDLLFSGSGTNVYLFDDASGTFVNDFLFGGGDDELLFRAQANGDHFDLDGIELTNIERLTFDAVGTNRDVIVEIDPDEVTITGSELSNTLAVTGNNATGSTEVILIDLSRSFSEDELDLSGWTFAAWGGQGEHVSIVGSARNDSITGSESNDVIATGGGGDTAYGGGGDDILISTGSPGDSLSLYGGSGNDTLQASGTTSQDLLFGGSGTNVYLFDDASGTFVNDFLFGGGDDELLFRAQANGDHFDLDGIELTNIERLTFDTVGTGRDVTVEIDPDEVTITGSELSNTLAVTGNNATGSTEVILIDLSRSFSEDELDLSGWTFSAWGGQGEHVSIVGSVRDDSISGTTEDDNIDGASGNDTIVFNGGSDTLSGGAGTADVLELGNASTGVTADLGSGTGSHGGDVLVLAGFERVNGSIFDDTLISGGTAGQSISLYGGSGNDTLQASGTTSQDLLFSGSGTNVYLFDDASGTFVNDFLFGGGDDELLFRAQANGDHFDLDGIELTNIERLTFDAVGTNRDVIVEIDPDEVTITGSELSNTLGVTGNNAAGSTEVILIDLSRSFSEDELDLSGWTFANWGGQGEHVSIVGSVRNDSISGATEDDNIDGASGNDTIVYNGGADTMSGGAGTADVLELGNASTGVTADLGSGTGSHGGDALVLAGFERVNGSNSGDTLISGGTAGQSISLYGGSGNDTLQASGTTSQDLLFSGSGTNVYLFDDASGTFVNDFLFGGGDDELLFRAQANGDHFDLDGIELTNIERLTFDAVGTNRDVIVEIDPDEVTITGSELSNTLAVTGNNAAGSTEVILIDLSRSFSEDELDLSGWTFSAWGGQGEHVSIVGSSRNDSITATQEDDVIATGGGGDTAYGGGGDDILISTGMLGDSISLYGGSGNDTLQGSGTASQDLLFSGIGTNVYLFDDASDTYVNDFLFGGGDDELLFRAQANGDHFDLDGIELTNIERLTFDTVGTGRDVTVEIDPDEVTITGSELSNTLAVTGNNATGSTEVILIDLSRSFSEDELDLSGWTFANWGGQGEHVSIVGSVRNDSITATQEDDVIATGGGGDTAYGRGGDDILAGGLGADTLYGGAGIDTADYSGSSAAVTVLLSSATGIGGDADGDQLFGIENLSGSNFNDVMLGDSGANTIDGGSGSDVLSGEGGSDMLHGGAGFDALSGADGGAGAADTLFGGADLDIAYYFTATSSQVVDFNDRKNLATNSGEHVLDTWDSIEGFYGADAHSNTITGDAQDNLFLGGSKADLIYGGDGSDILTARSGADVIYGGIGNDFIAGDGGTDDIYGGAGDDTFYIFATSGIDRIKDYSEVDDGFLFFQTGATQWSDLVFTVSGSDVHITHSGSSFTVIVEGATLADLDNSAGNFSFL